ncbi:MAG: DnaJ domain-containing protein [Myxococcota bacterium]
MVSRATTAGAVELPAELQAEIREFARTLQEMSYYEVLGVTSDASGDEIRAGFFERSKRFHPDRYFRKELGPYRELLGEIYKRVVMAHEVLREAKLRAEYDRKLGSARLGSGKPRPASPEAHAEPTPPAAQPTLRARRGLRPRGHALERLTQQIERSRRKAQGHYEEAMQQKNRGDWMRAVSLLRLAMTFDPRESRYHDALAELLPEVNAEQSSLLRARAEQQLGAGNPKEALPLLEEAFRLQPTDASVAARIAELAREGAADLAKACEFAAHAASLDEKNAEFRKILGRLYKAAGRTEEARREFQRAWELDPLDKEIKAELGTC